MEPKEIITLISVIILLLLTITIVILFVVFNNRKKKLLFEKEEIKANFRNELIKSTIEIREETLRNISWELHDNIGQLVTLAKIEAQQIKDNPDKIDGVITTIGKALSELRALSKSINPEAIKNLNLIEALNLEIERFNRLDYIDAQLHLEGKVQNIDSKKEIILFRILQEFFVNTLKHAKATQLNVTLIFEQDYLTIESSDDGIGFVNTNSKNGIGLSNMKNRAKLINAYFELKSEKNIGTQLVIKLPVNKQKLS